MILETFTASYPFTYLLERNLIHLINVEQDLDRRTKIAALTPTEQPVATANVTAGVSIMNK